MKSGEEMPRVGNTRNYAVKVLRCPKCNKTQTIRRKRSRNKKTGHVKHLYCHNCLKETGHVEEGTLQ